MNVFIRAMVKMAMHSPHENSFTIALINIHYLYNIATIDLARHDKMYILVVMSFPSCITACQRN